MHRQGSSLSYGFTSRWWGTMKQWNAEGCTVKGRPETVKAGEWGTHIVFWSFLNSKETDAKGNKKRIPFMRTYVVFNADQVEGDNIKKYRVGGFNDVNVQPDYVRAEQVITESGADVVYGGNRACYAPATGKIHCPFKSQFPLLQDFYYTMFHELAHWSEEKVGWLRKDFKEASAYAMGELIAEMSACFTAQTVNIPQSDNMDNHTQYLGCWLEAMKNDSKFIFQASKWASAITDFLVDHKLPTKYEGKDSEGVVADAAA
jgi:antirestriction protein ArdC